MSSIPEDVLILSFHFPKEIVKEVDTLRKRESDETNLNISRAAWVRRAIMREIERENEKHAAR